MAQLINFFLCFSALVETFYLFEDLTCCLRVCSRFINAFPVSQVLIISAAHPLTVSKSQSLQKEWYPKAQKTAPRLSHLWMEVVACPLTPPALPTDRSQCDFSVSQAHLWSLGSWERQQFCPVPRDRIPPWQCLSQSPTLPERACWLSQDHAGIKIIRTLPNLLSR